MGNVDALGPSCMGKRLLILLFVIKCTMLMMILNTLQSNYLFIHHLKPFPLTADHFSFTLSCKYSCRYSTTAKLAGNSLFPLNRSQEGTGSVVPDRKSLTMPVSRNRAGILHARLQQLGTLENAHTFNSSKMSCHQSMKLAS